MPINIDFTQATSLLQQAQIELARRDFFAYCNLLAADFYKEDRDFLVDLCGELQSFLDDDDHDVLVINEPPRHGKSRTGQNFVGWVLGRDTSKKIMTGSYNETLSTQFSKSVRNTIQEIKADDSKVVYSDIFPNTKIKRGDAAANLWSLEGSHNNYLATSPGGTATGFGADILVIDDVIKNAEEANNANILEGHWDWFVNTMLSRLEAGGKIIIIMTRWHSQDLAGRALSVLPTLGYKIKHVNMQAYDEDTDTMLCEDILSKQDYDRKVAAMGADIAAANYQQTPIDIKGKLYGEFKTYTLDELPTAGRIKRWAYVDTADTGADYLCSIAFVEHEGLAYIIDVIYTQEDMTVTERSVPDQFNNNSVNEAIIEANNGGKGFARVVRQKVDRTIVRDFHQSKNKASRIYSNSARVNQIVIMPQNWRQLWPDFFDAIMTYQRAGKNAHDDAPDALTGVVETMDNKINIDAALDTLQNMQTFFGRR